MIPEIMFTNLIWLYIVLVLIGIADDYTESKTLKGICKALAIYVVIELIFHKSMEDALARLL